jgi:hypothetical protein
MRLILPSREQDYMDAYFLAIFSKAVQKRMLSKKRASYVDVMPVADQEACLRSVFPYAGQELRMETFSDGFAFGSASRRWANSFL